MLENLIKNNEVKDHSLLSDSYLKLSKWTFDFKDQQVKHSVINQNTPLLSKYHHLNPHHHHHQENMTTQS